MPLIKSHSFIVKKANGIDDFRIQLRAAYWNGKITCEKKLRSALLKSIESTSQTNVKNSLMKMYNDNQLLEIMRYYGIIGGSERITFNQK